MKYLLLCIVVSICAWIGAPFITGIFADVDSLETETFASITTVRAEHNLPELEWSPQLYDLAKAHSKRMATSGRPWHSSHNYYENVFQGSVGTNIVKAWLASPEHKTNLLREEITKGAVSAEEKRGIIYATFMAE